MVAMEEGEEAEGEGEEEGRRHQDGEGVAEEEIRVEEAETPAIQVEEVVVERGLPKDLATRTQEPG